MKARKEVFFFEKKKQKTFANLGVSSPALAGEEGAQRVSAGKVRALRAAATRPAILFALVVAAVSMPRFANADSGSPPASGTTREAEKLYLMSGGDNLFSSYLERFIKNVTEALVKSSGQSSEMVSAAVNKIIAPDLSALQPAFGKEWVRLVAAHFSEDEIMQIEAFENTPIGRKWNLVREDIMRNFQDFAHDWGETNWPVIYQKHRKELEDLGIGTQRKAP